MYLLIQIFRRFTWNGHILFFFLSNRCNKKTVLCLPPGPQDGQFIWKRFLWWGILEFKQNLEHWFTRFHTLVWFFYEIFSSHLTQIVSPKSSWDINRWCETFFGKTDQKQFFSSSIICSENSCEFAFFLPKGESLNLSSLTLIRDSNLIQVSHALSF